MALSQPSVACTGTPGRSRLRATVRPLLAATAFAIGVAGASPALARDTGVRSVGDWTVTPSKDGNGCFLTRDYERNGGTTLMLGLDVDGTNRLSVLNANWSIKPKDKLTLNFRLSNSSYPAHFAVGIVSDGKQGFVTSFGAKFPSYFAGSKTLDIARGTVPVEKLSLDGGDAAVTALGKCVDEQRTAPAGASSGKTRSDDIPVDPFAPAPARKPKR